MTRLMGFCWLVTVPTDFCMVYISQYGDIPVPIKLNNGIPRERHSHFIKTTL